MNWYIFVTVILALGLVLVLLVTWTDFCITKVRDTLSETEWFTLQELIEMGCSAFWTDAILIMLYENGMIDVRIRTDTTTTVRECCVLMGFTEATVEDHEVRLIRRTWPKKRRRLRILKRKLAWSPAPA